MLQSTAAPQEPKIQPPSEPLADAPEVPPQFDDFDEEDVEVVDVGAPEFPPIRQIREEMEATDILAVIECGEDEQRSVYGGGSIIEAAETAATKYVISKTQAAEWPTDPIMATIFTRDAHFGPFPVDVDLTIDAKFLRGATDDDDE